MEWASLYAVTAVLAKLLINHPNAFCVLGNGTVCASLSALAALNANCWYWFALFISIDSDAGKVLIEFFIESL